MTGQIEAAQLTRRAFVYVRQSTLAQVLHHQESTMMQYDLRQRALALGWAPEAIEVIDEDQARTGTTLEGRRGFSRMADAVANGEAGGMFAVEVSRMARASEDWRVCWGCAGGRRMWSMVADLRPGDQDDKLLLGLGSHVRSGDPRRLRLQGPASTRHAAER
jgi:hypothetical protein